MEKKRVYWWAALLNLPLCCFSHNGNELGMLNKRAADFSSSKRPSICPFVNYSTSMKQHYLRVDLCKGWDWNELSNPLLDPQFPKITQEEETALPSPTQANVAMGWFLSPARWGAYIFLRKQGLVLKGKRKLKNPIKFLHILSNFHIFFSPEIIFLEGRKVIGSFPRQL